MINYSMWELNYTIFVLNILAQGLQENLKYIFIKSIKYELNRLDRFCILSSWGKKDGSILILKLFKY